MKNKNACAYRRSSKDRHEVSIDVQDRELGQLARDRGLVIVEKFTDVVESGKDEHRPDFQRLIAALRSPGRAWGTILILDTSRLSRRRHIAWFFEREAEKHGVEVVYKSMPDTDPVTGMLLRSIVQTMDEWHSLTSKQKGLAGMAENVRQGYRAGGRAPHGYRLKHTPTGALRDGEQVTKSVLEPSPDAAMVARYLKARAAGRSRRALAQELNMPWPDSSLIDMEWCALTYAGHTVWNMRNESTRGQGYKGKRKRRPRSEWMVRRDTHPALITDAEAETLLHALENSASSLARRTPADYLLTGLLCGPDGDPWRGNGSKRYRLRRAKGSAHIGADTIEPVVLRQMMTDLQSAAFVHQMTKEAKAHAAKYDTDPAADLRKAIASINARISKTMDLAAQLADPAPALRKVDELEQERARTLAEITRAEQENEGAALLKNITEAEVKRLLAGVAEDLDTLPREAVKDLLGQLVERIELDPDTLECRLHYRIGVSGRNRMASPRGVGAIPILRAVSLLRVA